MKKNSSIKTISDVLTAAAVSHGNRTAYIDHGRHYSFQGVNEVANFLANRFAAAGIGKGDRIAIIALNQIEWVYAFFAAAKLGAVIVGLNVRYREMELDYMLKDSMAKAVVSLSEYSGFNYARYFSEAEERLPDLKHWIYLDALGNAGEMLFSSLLPGGDHVVVSSTDERFVDPEDPLMIIYTSGTTGKPKGAALTHQSILAAATAQAEHIRATSDDVIQLASPLNHVGGSTCGIITFLLVGGTCELVPVFKAEKVLEMAAEHPPTVISGVPTMLMLLLMNPKIEEIDLSGVRMVITGGSNVDDTLLTRLQKALPNARLMNLYGLTEASGAIVMTPWDCARDDLMSSIGKPLAGAEIRVSLPNGELAPIGGVGELWFKGLGVLHSYIGPQNRGDTFDSDGWLHSGDLGYVDQRGYVFLVGRKGDMYIQGGFNVYPAEIENVIATHPEVLMVAGIGVPDPVLGEIGRYYVVAKQGSTLKEHDVIEFCRTRIADYKVPRQVVLRDELPMTPVGKIKKSLLRSE